MNIKWMKNKVIEWRTNGREKQGNILAEAIASYEKSQITSYKLVEIYNQLK